MLKFRRACFILFPQKPDVFVWITSICWTGGRGNEWTSPSCCCAVHANRMWSYCHQPVCTSSPHFLLPVSDFWRCKSDVFRSQLLRLKISNSNNSLSLSKKEKWPIKINDKHKGRSIFYGNLVLH